MNEDKSPIDFNPSVAYFPDMKVSELDKLLVIFKVHYHCIQAVISEDIEKILKRRFPTEDYSDPDSKAFFEKYKGTTCYVFYDGTDWWVLEDNNYVITRECFEPLKEEDSDGI